MVLRLKLVSILFLFSFAALIAKLFFWQLIEGRVLSTQAREQYEAGKVISAPRGNILAKDGSWLAARGESWLVFATLPEIEEGAEGIADKLALLFTESEEEYEKLLLDESLRIRSLLLKNNVVWVPLKHRVTSETKKEIEVLNIKGIGFELEEARVYPEASSAAHLLGFVGKNKEGEDIGYFGLEGYYDPALAGKPGFVSQELDAQGTPILIGDSQEITAIGGVDLLTHIDKAVQLTLDESLLEGIEKYGAKGGTGVVMNAKTGAVIAMSSYPSYDPSKYFEFGDEYFKNPAVSDVFEPGSIFKILVMASALDAAVVKPDTKCDICDGPLKVDKYLIETWNKEYDKDRSMTDVIVNSDNVGMVFVGRKLGADKLYDYLSAFGIGSLTGIDLQGEVSGKLREKSTWNIVDLATASFGQGVSLTPIQMIRAVSVIANNGLLATPQVVDKIVGDAWQEDIEPIAGKRVISEPAAKEITAMMVEAAKNGEAKWTHLRGFRVAGKTGTAQIPIAGFYDDEKTIASFVGFAPYDDPKFVMLVTLREPKTSPWASETAAPLWYSIARDLFIYFGVQPEI